jgi:hypothetical protein
MDDTAAAVDWPMKGKLPELLASTRRASEQRVGWDYSAWATLPWPFDDRVHPVLTRLEDAWADDEGITRSAVAAAADGDPIGLLVASMVWGFGTLAYGPKRTLDMLMAPDVEDSATRIIAAAAVSPEDGFRALFADRRAVIPGLSIAMGTKLLYFAAPPQGGVVTPVVYDVVVHRVLRELAPNLKAPSPRGYMTGDQYRAVCKWMSDIAEAVGEGRRADDVEYALFQYPIWARRQESLQRRGKQR